MPAGAARAGSGERYVESLELFGMRFGLERMHRLLERLDHPEARFDAVHVVGTNGKSSTVRFAEALFEAQGVRSGAYLSPHLTGFRERIRLGGQTIDEERYDASLARVEAAAGLEVTQFEALTAAALVAFAEAGVEWAVIEAGLGGRLDATNVLARSRVQVLTNISLEHTQLLGSTEEAIAREKLAVVPPGGTLVLGEPGWERLAPQAGRVETVVVDGSFQDQNRAVALRAAELALGRRLDPAPMLAVRVPGRLEVRESRPLEIWDGAHNPAGMRRLVAEVPALVAGRRVVAVVSALGEKDVAGMLAELCTLTGSVIATQSSNARAMPAAELGRLSGGRVVERPDQALAAARAEAGADGAVLVCGSLYLLHDLAQQSVLDAAGTRV